MRTLIHSATVVSGGETLAHGWIEFSSAGKITARGVGEDWRGREGIENSIDAGGHYLTPGFIDIHAHGGGGASFEDGVEQIHTALELHRSHGTTRSVLSLVSGEIDVLATKLGVIAELASKNPLILGSHLEGPFLDPGHRGAHDPAALHAPGDAEIQRLIEAGRGHLVQVTLAPELPGAFDAITRLDAAGVAVAMGHTNADYETARAAIQAGARILTHAFNAMPGIHHRAPGPVIAALEDERVTLEIINDGVHVHPSVVAVAFGRAPGRIALITDAMAAAGGADGEYFLGSQAVTVSGGIARLSTGDSIAGSTLTQDAALRRAVTEVGISLADAVDALTRVPAAAVGRAADLGRLNVGFAADAVLLNERLEVTRVWAEGTERYAR